MSGHSRWWIEHPEAAPADEHMIQHIQGYILAMEDVLRGLDAFRTEKSSDAEIIEALELCVVGSLASAMRTLETITKKVDAAE